MSNEEYQRMRAGLWISVLSAYVSAWNSRSIDGAVKWADEAVMAFDKRFALGASGKIGGTDECR